MTIKYIVPGSKRQELAKCIADWLGEDVKYLGAPSFAYEVDYFTIDKDGNLKFDDSADSEVIERLIEHLYDEGFEFEEPNTDNGYTVSLNGFNDESLINLYSIVAAKSALIKKVFGLDTLPINVLEDVVYFPWMKDEQSEAEKKACQHFVTALCDLAKKQKRANGKVKEVDNEKYAFRCFLLRLGFIGDEYKEERKILLRNLEGNSAFKGERKDGEEL